MQPRRAVGPAEYVQEGAGHPGRPVATILDTKGPEIRIKTFADGPVTLEQGQGFILTTDDVPGDGRRVSVTYANLHKEVGPGCASWWTTASSSCGSRR